MAHPLFLYENISAQLRGHICCGSYKAGERLPSVRQLSQTFGVSINTVIQCFRQLEMDGFIEVRPRSGVYVSHTPPRDLSLSESHHFDLLPVDVSLSDDILHYMEQEDLFLNAGQAYARMRPLTVHRDPNHWYDLGEASARPLVDTWRCDT